MFHKHMKPGIKIMRKINRTRRPATIASEISGAFMEVVFSNTFESAAGAASAFSGTGAASAFSAAGAASASVSRVVNNNANLCFVRVEIVRSVSTNPASSSSSTERVKISVTPLSKADSCTARSRKDASGLSETAAISSLRALRSTDA